MSGSAVECRPDGTPWVVQARAQIWKGNPQ